MKSPRKSTKKRTSSPSRTTTVGPHKTLDKFRVLEFIKQKLDFCDEIYSLLQEISKNNREIQEHLFTLMPNFQLQAKYLPSACQCIYKVIDSNAQILTKIARTVKFNFDFNSLLNENKEQKLNIIINIIDNQEKSSEIPRNLALMKQDKLTNKPMNLLNFFMNLLWDPSTTIKQEYLRFLRCLCKVQDKGVNINQEMIYKLYNCMTLYKRENPLTNARV